MPLVVDLHIHSRFSRATSKDLTLPNLYYWSKIKGINLLGTGDFTHPQWSQELTEQLQPTEDGLYQLKPEFADPIDVILPASVKDNPVYFIPTVEISNIYKRHDQVRKLHNVIVAPNLTTVAKINTKLADIGNLKSDGRPILGLDSEDLLKIVKQANPDTMFIPAHIWTPWFAMFGSKSGFNSIEEAFGESKNLLSAVETGLSADPKMCRQIANIDGLTLVSHSDAHSCKKLAREANLIDISPSYTQLKQAIETGDDRFIGTIEFYPQEGKYHADGCANCQLRCTPQETQRYQGRCPNCNRLITVGVLNRVTQVAVHHPKPSRGVNKQVLYIVPLAEIIAEIVGVKNPQSKKVEAKYFDLINQLGPEFHILTECSLADIKQAGGEHLALAIQRMRAGDIVVEPGYDGIFGTVKIFADPSDDPNQLSLI